MSPGKDLSKWSDQFMFTAEKSDNTKDPEAFLLNGSPDPLGQIAAACKTYLGEYTHDLADITDEERRHYLTQIQNTVLTMPLETVSLHFFIEGVHRGITHQMVRQRTAAFAQESTRFAVKEDLATAVTLPPSLRNTVSWDMWCAEVYADAQKLGITMGGAETMATAANTATRAQKHRKVWDDAVEALAEAYNALIEDGMPAEEARGLQPTNTLTRLNYITNLRSFYDTMSKRVGDQASFEWRMVIAAMVRAMQDFGDKAEYEVWATAEDDTGLAFGTTEPYKIRKSSRWQYDAIVAEIKPIEFKLGKRAFGADFDRPSRIGERVDAFAAMGVPSSRWIEGAPEYNIPGIHPEEWLLDPHSARLDGKTEFDIWGNRVPKGTGVHWTKEPFANASDGPGLVDAEGNVMGWDGSKVVEI